MIKGGLHFVFVMLLGSSVALAQAGSGSPPTAPSLPSQKNLPIGSGAHVQGNPQDQMPPQGPMNPHGDANMPPDQMNQPPFSENPGSFPVQTPPLSPEPMNTRPMDGLSARDPFRLPEGLIIKLRQKNAMNGPGGIDPSVEPIRRFPLASYNLVGIIWDVKKPKAMFMDRLKSIHMVQVNDFIGNAKGVIVSIQSGAVTVLEGKIPQIIKLKK